MRIATIKVTPMAAYSQSKALKVEKERAEDYQAFEERIWKERMHVDENGEVYIPAMCILNGMACAAAYLSKGGELKKKGNATWSQNFNSGLAVAEGAGIGKKAEDAKPEWVYCHADGKRGSGKRVWRCFPIFKDWSATFVIHILDDTIPEDVFARVVAAFGLFNGVGRFRPQNGGNLGRFIVESIKIEKA